MTFYRFDAPIHWSTRNINEFDEWRREMRDATDRRHTGHIWRKITQQRAAAESVSIATTISQSHCENERAFPVDCRCIYLFWIRKRTSAQQTVWIALNNSKMPRTWKRKVSLTSIAHERRTKTRGEREKKILKIYARTRNGSNWAIAASSRPASDAETTGKRQSNEGIRMELDRTNAVTAEKPKKKKFSAVLSLFLFFCFHRFICVLCGVAWCGVFFAWCIRWFVDVFSMNERNRNCTHDFIMCIYLITNIINHH